MNSKMRGAEELVRQLVLAGTRRVFTLSGNQIMPVFDAAIEAPLELLHVRHEAAAVHIADAWGRLTGEPGVALVTAAPGFANCLSALYVALMAESPMLLISGHAPLNEVERGAFQAMPQSEMAQHVTKVSWTVNDASKIASAVALAYEIATTERPGPVHLSIPVNILEATIDSPSPPQTVASTSREPTSDTPVPLAAQVLDELSRSQRPLMLAGPAMMRCPWFHRLGEITGIPAVGMESPRGVNDPSLGAFAEVLREADLILMLGKKLDFTLRLQGEPAYSSSCRLVQIDAEHAALDLSKRVLRDNSRIAEMVCADPRSATIKLCRLAEQRTWSRAAWADEVQAAIAYRPSEWSMLQTSSDSANGSALHPAEVCRAVQRFLGDGSETVFVGDGGEFGQWAQACIRASHRIINGPSGSIGCGVPFAIAARLAFPTAKIVAASGDGSIGFHAMEFETAARCKLPFVTVIGNDARWNAEIQLQIKNYGPERVFGCELMETRYHQMVAAVGGHKEHVTEANQLASALDRAHASQLPACVNAMIEPVAAPVIRRTGYPASATSSPSATS